MLTVTDQKFKNRKNHKTDVIDHHHIASMSMWCWVISSFKDFCGCWSDAVNIIRCHSTACTGENKMMVICHHCGWF